MNLIVIDVETTGLDPLKHGILAIGAKKADSGAEFYVECQLGDGLEFQEEALVVNGFAAASLRCPKKPTEAQAIRDLFAFAGRYPLLAGMNPGKFDLMFIDAAAQRAGLMNPFPHRTVDLHTLAIQRALQIGQEIPLRGFYTDSIYALLGMEPEPKPHNALTGARMEYLAFQRIFRTEVEA